LSGELCGDIVLHMDKPTDMRSACAKCGRRNDEDANFCQNCGAPIVRKPEISKARLVITERAVQELKGVRATNAKDAHDVLRIDNEPDGLSLSVGPRQGGDCLVGSEDTMLLHASAEAARLLGERSMVIHCIDGRLIIYAEDDETGADAS
jgi:DNA-directed RNA polymerase subunit RPC12/RpoP